MTSVPHDQPALTRGSTKPAPELELRALWASIAISMIWLAVLFAAVWGPDFVSQSGGSVTTIPSAVVVSFFAFLATSAVARYGLGPSAKREKGESD